MCSGSKRKLSPTNFIMEGENQKQKEEFFSNGSILLELSAADDLIGFNRAVDEEGFDVDEASFWYGRSIGSRKMGFEERTPLMISAIFGSSAVLNYILSTGRVDVNRACGSDGATALHCAIAGGSSASIEIVKLLLDASADVNSLDSNGNRPRDLIPHVLKPNWESKKKTLEMMLGCVSSNEIDDQSEEEQTQTPQKEGNEKKEYPMDPSLPDIKNGIYGTDEFRMYTFKVKPCSRAYSHDWTECPFVHPGENARRRDPRKYHYSCVPCPEFRKGTCRQGDACEYAHGVFECWLHPAQYRTRLCKDETGCTRRVCFFAHKPEELRPLYASTGSAVPSPRSSSVSSLDMLSMSPSVLMHPTSTPPMSPSVSSPMGCGGSMWQNQSSVVPPTLQLPGSRLKTSLNARDLELDLNLLHLNKQLMDEMSNISPQTNWTTNSLASRLGGVKPTNLDDVFGSLDPSVLSQLQGLTLKASAPQAQSPTGIPIRQNNMNPQLRSSYSNSLSSSPVRKISSFGLDPSGVTAGMNSRSAALAKRSQSFIDRGALNRHIGHTALATAATTLSSTLSDWSSPNGKLDWGVQGEELNKLRKSASFGLRSNEGNVSSNTAMGSFAEEPDFSWVQSMVKDVPAGGSGQFGMEVQQQQYHLNSGGGLEMLPPWVEQLYKEQEQMVA